MSVLTESSTIASHAGENLSCSARRQSARHLTLHQHHDILRLCARDTRCAHHQTLCRCRQADMKERGSGTTPLAYLHVDCDLYAGAKDIFSYLNEKIVPGTVILFDELVNYKLYKEHEVGHDVMTRPCTSACLVRMCRQCIGSSHPSTVLAGAQPGSSLPRHMHGDFCSGACSKLC